jgi:hypothetical protein
MHVHGYFYDFKMAMSNKSGLSDVLQQLVIKEHNKERRK